MTRKEQFVIGAFAVAVIVGGLTIYVHERAASNGRIAPGPEPAVEQTPRPNKPEPPPEIPQPVQAQAPNLRETPPSTVTVSVAGAVARPGLYQFARDARIHDLLTTAGGTLQGADLTDINLAARLIDGSTLTVPWGRVAEIQNDTLVMRPGQSAAAKNPPQYTISGQHQPERAAGTSASPDRQAPTTNPIDLNTASAETLQSLPGIGEKLAQDILQFRQQTPFQTVDDVTKVRGIGPKRLEAIRPFVTVK